MKAQLKKFASVFLAAALLFSMCAVLSVSAAETGDAAGAGTLEVAATSNYCTATDVSVAQGSTATVVFKAPVALSVVDVQWGLTYDKSKLTLTNVTSFTADMLTNLNSTSYTAMGSVSNNGTPYALAAGDTMFTFTFTATGTGSTTVNLNLVDLMNRTDSGDVVVVRNGTVQTTSPLTINAKSNFFAESTYVMENISQYEDTDGNAYVTVEYKLRSADKSIVNVDIDQLTYDPAVLEWDASYNTFGTGRDAVVDFFAFAAENGYGEGQVQKTAAGRIVGNFSAVNPAIPAQDSEGNAVAVVKATFKILDRNAGSTDVTCTVDTLALCDASASEPTLQYLPIDKKVVNATDKAKATYETEIYPLGGEGNLVGDANNDGVVDINDATLIQRYLAEYQTGLNMNDEATFARCDANRDGKISIKDATHIQRYLAEFIQAL